MYPIKYGRRKADRQRRRQKKLAVVFLSFCILVGASLLMGSGKAADMPQYTEWVVQPGDTLWKVARSHLPAGMDIREYVFLIKKANGVSNSIIQPGEVLLLPVL